MKPRYRKFPELLSIVSSIYVSAATRKTFQAPDKAAAIDHNVQVSPKHTVIKLDGCVFCVSLMLLQKTRFSSLRSYSSFLFRARKKGFYFGKKLIEELTKPSAEILHLMRNISN